MPMPVTKFRDADEARRALWLPPGASGLARRIRELWRWSARLAPPVVARGVRKFRSIEDANAEREARSSRRIAELSRRRSS
jgi:hypothetical protein